MRLAVSGLRDPSTSPVHLVPLGVHFEIEFDEDSSRTAKLNVKTALTRQELPLTPQLPDFALAFANSQTPNADAARLYRRGTEESICGTYVDNDSSADVFKLNCLRVKPGTIEEAQKRMALLFR